MGSQRGLSVSLPGFPSDPPPESVECTQWESRHQPSQEHRQRVPTCSPLWPGKGQRERESFMLFTWKCEGRSVLMKEGLTAMFVSIQNNNNVYLLHAILHHSTLLTQGLIDGYEILECWRCYNICRMGLMGVWVHTWFFCNVGLLKMQKTLAILAMMVPKQREKPMEVSQGWICRKRYIWM